MLWLLRGDPNSTVDVSLQSADGFHNRTVRRIRDALGTGALWGKRASRGLRRGLAVPTLRDQMRSAVAGAFQVAGRSRRATHGAGAGAGNVAGRVARAGHAAALPDADAGGRIARAIEATRAPTTASAHVVIGAVDRTARRTAQIGIERTRCSRRAGAGRAAALGGRAVASAGNEQ